MICIFVLTDWVSFVGDVLLRFRRVFFCFLSALVLVGVVGSVSFLVGDFYCDAGIFSPWVGRGIIYCATDSADICNQPVEMLICVYEMRWVGCVEGLLFYVIC